MPRTTLPLTPGASGDILGKDQTYLPISEKTFNLPPPAISQSRANAPASTPKSIQPATSPHFSLPPPPTRSRTIIQMKPKPQQNEPSADKRPTAKGSAGSGKKTSTQAGASGKKQPSSMSVAGKKIARKTAHSVIERRRRSKMNEEFGVLKAMIPACTDQEMHKLAILQVRQSILCRPVIERQKEQRLKHILGEHRLPPLPRELHQRSQSRQQITLHPPAPASTSTTPQHLHAPFPPPIRRRRRCRGRGR